jgi:predicted kinase
MEMNDLIELFQKRCPRAVKAMVESSHHFDDQNINKYHQEGDVWTHVNMVCLLAQLFKLNDLSKLTCLLHDIGKPLSREVDYEKKKVGFYGHEGISVFQSIDCINQMDLKLSDHDLIHVLQLISLHTSLFKLVKGEGIQKDIASKFVRNKRLLQDLIVVSKCDSMGRFYKPVPGEVFPRENIEEFFAPTVESIQNEQKYRKTIKNLTILVGPPMSGKSTWVKENAGDSLVISRDEITMKVAGKDNYNNAYHSIDQKLVDKELEKVKIDAFKSGRDLIFDLTNMSVKARRRLWLRVPAIYNKKAVVFFTSYEELLKRNISRTQKESKTVRLSSLRTLLSAFSVPLYDEFDEIEYKVFRETG